MRQTSVRVVKNSAALFTATLLERGIAFLLPVYIARALGPEQMGAYSTAITFVLLAVPLAVWGLDQLVFRIVARDRAGLARSLLNATALLAGTVTLTVVIFAAATLLLDYPDSLESLILFSLLLVVPVYALSTLLETGIKALEQMEWLVVVRLPLTLARVLISILLLYLGFELYAVVTLLALYYAGMCIWYVVILKRIVVDRATGEPPVLQSTLMRSLFWGALPLMAIGVLGVTFKQIDRILLSKLDGVSAVGLYSTGAMVVMLVYLLAPAIMESLFPGLARAYERQGQRFSVLTTQLLKVIFIMIAPIALAVFALAQPIVLSIFSMEYAPAVNVTRILAIGIVPAYLSRLLFRVMLASNNERVTLRIALVNTAINIALNLMLIPRFGMLGAATAAVATEFAGFGQNLVFIHRRIVAIELGPALAHPLACAVLGLVAYWCVSWWHVLPALLLAVAVFGAALILSRTISRKDLYAIAGT